MNSNFEKILSYALSMESTLKSDIQEGYVPKGHKSLSDFKKEQVKKITSEMKSSSLTFFKHIDANRDTTMIWRDKDDEIVGVGSVRYAKTGDNEYNWITAIQVNPKYRGYGLGDQILKYCVSTLKGNALTVATDNKIALEMYKRHGFEISKESLADVKAGRRKVYFMYLNEKSDDSYKISKSSKSYSIKDDNGKILSKLNYYDYSKKNFDWILISDVETEEKFRSKGLGSKLINELYDDIMKKTPNKGIYLLVRADNKRAIEFYKKNKFIFAKKYEMKDGMYNVMCRGNASIQQLIDMNFR